MIKKFAEKPIFYAMYKSKSIIERYSDNWYFYAFYKQSAMLLNILLIYIKRHQILFNLGLFLFNFINICTKLHIFAQYLCVRFP